MPLCYITTAYLTLEVKKGELSVFANNISIQMLSLLTAHSQTILFALNMSDNIQRRHV